MRSKAFPMLVLVAALAGLAATVGWAASRDRGDGWTMIRYGSAGMMGYPAAGRERVGNLTQAKRQAQRFANRLDLRVAEVMRFSNHYYVELEERDGRAATEVLVEPDTGSVFLEYGPAMMWNTRYGMMSDFRLRSSGGMMDGGMMGGSDGGMMGGSDGGMMGSGNGMMGSGNGMMGGSGGPTWTPGTATGEVTPTKARTLASRWLASQDSRLTAGEAEAFPGYFTLHVLRGGRIAGMLSVNAATGAVWNHSWHGRFVSMLES